MNPYDELVLTSNPVAYLPLDGRPTDLTKGHVPTITGSPGTTVLPNGDAAYSFNGITDYIEVPTADDLSVATTGQFCVEAWVRPDVLQFTHEDPDGYVYILGKGVASQDEWAFRMYSLLTPGEDPPRPNRVSFYVWELAGGEGSGSYFQDPITAQTWMYLVATVDLTVTPQYPLGGWRSTGMASSGRPLVSNSSKLFPRTGPHQCGSGPETARTSSRARSAKWLFTTACSHRTRSRPESPQCPREPMRPEGASRPLNNIQVEAERVAVEAEFVLVVQGSAMISARHWRRRRPQLEAAPRCARLPKGERCQSQCRAIKRRTR